MLRLIVPSPVPEVQLSTAVSTRPRTTHDHGTWRVRARPMKKKKIGAAARPTTRQEGSSAKRRRLGSLNSKSEGAVYLRFGTEALEAQFTEVLGRLRFE